MGFVVPRGSLPYCDGTGFTWAPSIHASEMYSNRSRHICLLTVKSSIFAVENMQGPVSWYLMLFRIWKTCKHRWFSGRILACHAGGPGSIPGRCKEFLFSNFSQTITILVLELDHIMSSMLHTILNASSCPTSVPHWCPSDNIEFIPISKGGIMIAISPLWYSKDS